MQTHHFKTNQQTIFSILKRNKLKCHCDLQSLPDQRVQFLGLNVIHLLQCIFNLPISTHVNYQNQCSVIFNLLLGKFWSQKILENLIMVQFIPLSSANAWILWVLILFQCLRTLEGHLCMNLLGFLPDSPHIFDKLSHL